MKKAAIMKISGNDIEFRVSKKPWQKYVCARTALKVINRYWPKAIVEHLSQPDAFDSQESLCLAQKTSRKFPVLYDDLPINVFEIFIDKDKKSHKLVEELGITSRTKHRNMFFFFSDRKKESSMCFVVGDYYGHATTKNIIDQIEDELIYNKNLVGYKGRTKSSLKRLDKNKTFR